MDRSLKVRNCVSNQDLLGSFASIAKMENNKNEVVIVYYIAVTEVSPRTTVPHFTYERFGGKGVDKLLINLIQIVSNMLSNGVENVVMLKCVQELESFCETIGKQLVLQNYINHQSGYNFKKLSIIIIAIILLKTYILQPDAIIDH